MMKKGKKTEDLCPLLVNRSGHSEVPRIASLVTWRPEHNNARGLVILKCMLWLQAIHFHSIFCQGAGVG